MVADNNNNDVDLYRAIFHEKLEHVSNCKWTASDNENKNNNNNNNNNNNKSSSPSILFIFLEDLANEIALEREQKNVVDINEEFAERVLYSRLSTITSASQRQSSNNYNNNNNIQSKFLYLLQTFHRADDELRKSTLAMFGNDKIVKEKFEALMQEVKKLCVSYGGLALNPDTEIRGTRKEPGMFPITEWEEHYGVNEFSHRLYTGEMSQLYLDEFCKKFEEDDPELLDKIFLNERQWTFTKDSAKPTDPFTLQGMSILGDFDPFFRAMFMVAASPIAAARLVRHPFWTPERRNTEIFPALPMHVMTMRNFNYSNARTSEGYVLGKDFEECSVLGAFFALSPMWAKCPTMNSPNGRREPHLFPSLFPSVDLAWSPKMKMRVSERDSAQRTIWMHMARVYEGLNAIVKTLLKHGGSTRDGVMKWIFVNLRVNKKRSQREQQLSWFENSSDGYFVNFSSTMLRLSLPFTDILNGTGKHLPKIKAEYTLSKSCGITDYKDSTRLGMSESEAQQCVESGEFDLMNDASWGFVCECFFATHRAMHLGIVACISDLKEHHRHRTIRRYTDRVRDLQEDLQSLAANDPHRREYLAELDQLQLKRHGFIQQAILCDATLLDPRLVSDCFAFYRLTCVWLLNAARGEEQMVISTPLTATQLPDEASKTFRGIPEEIVEDTLDYLEYVMQHAANSSHSLIENEILTEVVDFLVLFSGATEHIKNPYLRCKFVATIHAFLPDFSGSDKLARVMFETNASAFQFLIPNLLKIFAEAERAVGYYEKFNVRKEIGDICEYLWGIPEYRSGWKIFAETQLRFYAQFVDMLINDSVHSLGAAMERLPEIREREALMADENAWNQLTDEERTDHQERHKRCEEELRSDLFFANQNIEMMAYTSKEIASPFLRPEIIKRVADMLNYFLSHLAGPERRKLKVKNPEKYEFNPKDLLTKIVTVYVNLYKTEEMIQGSSDNMEADSDKTFGEAICEDGRSYKDEIFSMAVNVVSNHCLLSPTDIETFQKVQKVAKKAADDAVDLEADLGEIPDEFQDPLMCTLMKDPVIVPITKSVCDRATIERHLLSNETCPFSRQPLKVEDLVSDVELKRRIDEWVKLKKDESRRSK
jgi:ubiquitin conjugation factor E4 B